MGKRDNKRYFQCAQKHRERRPLVQASEHRRLLLGLWEGGSEDGGPPLMAFEKRKKKMKPYHNTTIGGWR
jgi:hypothetical protein